MRLSSSSTLLAGAAAALLAVAAHSKVDFVQAQGPIFGTDTQNTLFGISPELSKDGSVMAVGAPNFPPSNTGGVYVYHYLKMNKQWVNVTSRLEGTGVGVNAFFGSDLSLSDSGKTLVVSAPNFRPAGTGEGTFYVYTMDKEYVWRERSGPVRPMANTAGSNFGQALALSGNGQVLVVGAGAFGANLEGAIWIYQVAPISGQVKELQGPLAPQQTQPNMNFGSEVAINYKGDVIVVSGDGFNTNEGAVWVFRHNKHQQIWVQEAGPLQPTGNKNGFLFGSFGNLDINAKGNLIAAGGKGLEQNTGGVWTFELQKQGAGGARAWVQTQGPIQGSNLEIGDEFGLGLKLDGAGKTLLIGAPAFGTFSEGAFYVFKKTRKGFVQAQGPVVGKGANFARTLTLSADGRVATIGSTAIGGNTGATWNFVN